MIEERLTDEQMDTIIKDSMMFNIHSIGDVVKTNLVIIELLNRISEKK